MARKTGIPQPTIGRIKSGRTMPDIANLESIAKAYGFELWQLLVKGFDPKSPPALRYASQAEEMLYRKFKELQAELSRMN